VVAVVDARRGEVFAAAYDFSSPAAGEDPDPAAVRDDQSEAMAPEDLAMWLDDLASGGPLLVVGDGAVRYLELLAPRHGLDLGLADTVSAPPPAVLARLAARRLAAGEAPRAARDVAPDYRRHADAKINWEERAPQRTATPPMPGSS
jgi:tRNA A37 threonylcarbamoyladenosine modification protein TsaB